MDKASYSHYQSMTADVITALSKMADLCGELEMTETREKLNASCEGLKNHRFSVGIMGEFKRGKSTVINSLLESDILPSDVLPATATMNRVTYGMEPRVVLEIMDGSTRRVRVNELKRYVTKLTDDGESLASEVHEAVVFYPCVFCQNGVDIVDTPGLNDDERMDKICEEIIPKLDAVIMVLTQDNPFSESEANFVRRKLMTSDLSRIIFLVNKMDNVRRAADRERILREIRNRIEAAVLKKTASMYGEESKQYQDAIQKLGKIKILPFSALDALDGKLDHDTAMIEKSGTKQFEAALTNMLTVERGALELSKPLNILRTSYLEIIKNIEARRNALSMSVKEFEERQEAAMEEINTLREKKKQEELRLKNRCDETKRDLAETATEYYVTLENELKQIVDDYVPESMEKMKDKAGQEKAAEDLKKQLANASKTEMSEFSEKMIVKLQDIISVEAMRSSEFTSEMFAALDKIRIGDDTGLDIGNLAATGIDVLTDYIGVYGIGGIIAGYRVAGLRGAIVGGGAGLAANLAVASILGALSIGGLPLLVISCFTGTFVSKKITTFLFGGGNGQKELKKMKEQFKTNISKSVEEMRKNREVETWIETLVGSQFEEVIEQFNEECETVMRDTENTINGIRNDMAKNIANREAAEKQLNLAEERCQETLKHLDSVNAQVSSALKSLETT